jgi:hypothetical protein
MSRDLVDQMGDRGRAPRDFDDSSDRVEKVSLHDLTMALHYDTGKAVLVSDDGHESKAVWLPHSLIQIEKLNRTTVGEKKNGQMVTLDLVTITVPERIAKEKGLI